MIQFCKENGKTITFIILCLIICIFLNMKNHENTEIESSSSQNVHMIEILFDNKSTRDINFVEMGIVLNENNSRVSNSNLEYREIKINDFQWGKERNGFLVSYIPNLIFYVEIHCDDSVKRPLKWYFLLKDKQNIYESQNMVFELIGGDVLELTSKDQFVNKDLDYLLSVINIGEKSEVTYSAVQIGTEIKVTETVVGPARKNKEVIEFEVPRFLYEKSSLFEKGNLFCKEQQHKMTTCYAHCTFDIKGDEIAYLAFIPFYYYFYNEESELDWKSTDHRYYEFVPNAEEDLIEGIYQLKYN